MTPSESTQKHRRGKSPGILAIVPDTLPFHPYRNHHPTHQRAPKAPRGRRHADTETGPSSAADSSIGNDDFIPNAPLFHCRDGWKDDDFVLFFFVDFTNRQSLLAIPIVSKWCHYVLSRGGREGTESGNVVCIPNHPTPVNHRSDAFVLDPSNTGTFTLRYSGFYELPFEHSARLPLIHLLSVTRVPTVVVVNGMGRLVTTYGWEAIEREGCRGGTLDGWIDRLFVAKKKYDEDRTVMESEFGQDGELSRFDSDVVEEWRQGRSGLAWWWHLFGLLM